MRMGRMDSEDRQRVLCRVLVHWKDGEGRRCSWDSSVGRTTWLCGSLLRIRVVSCRLLLTGCRYLLASKK
jgi:hypothetical protein